MEGWEGRGGLLVLEEGELGLFFVEEGFEHLELFLQGGDLGGGMLVIFDHALACSHSRTCCCRA